MCIYTKKNINVALSVHFSSLAATHPARPSSDLFRELPSTTKTHRPPATGLLEAPVPWCWTNHIDVLYSLGHRHDLMVFFWIILYIYMFSHSTSKNHLRFNPQKQFSDCGQEVLAAQYCRCLVRSYSPQAGSLQQIHLCVETRVCSACVPQTIPTVQSSSINCRSSTTEK